MAGKFLLTTIAALPLATPALAEITPGGGHIGFSCAEGCTFEADFGSGVDYTLPQIRERWTFRLESEDPLATFHLSAPSYIDSFVTRRDKDGIFRNYYDGAPDPEQYLVLFDQIVNPLLTTIDVAVFGSYNNCSPQTPVDNICAIIYRGVGNAAGYGFDSSEPVTLFTQFAVVPEPQSWAMMIAGFSLVGASIRRTRRGSSYT